MAGRRFRLIESAKMKRMKKKKLKKNKMDIIKV